MAKRLFHRSKSYLTERRSSPLFWLQIVYLGFVLFLVLFWRAFWTPDALFLLLFVLFLLLGKGKKFFLNFAPFIVLLLTYDSLRGIADNLAGRVHIMEMIDFDRWIGLGTLPTIHLQNLLWGGQVSLLDYYFYLLYMAHFLFPVLLAVYIWLKRPGYYLRYISALVVLSYLGFLTYIIYPAMPPWMASDQGYIPKIAKISTEIWFSMGVNDFPTIYKKLNPNPIAAIPSLHAAYPVLFLLFVHRLKGRRWSLPFLIYPISVWAGIVYMGEHYLVDALVGGVYAVGVYYAVMKLFDRYGADVRTRWERVSGRADEIRTNLKRRAQKRRI